jgi:hypothetical protein
MCRRLFLLPKLCRNAQFFCRAHFVRRIFPLLRCYRYFSRPRDVGRLGLDHDTRRFSALVCSRVRGAHLLGRA